MKPDAYMPFYGNAFFLATKGMSPVSILAYIQAIWFYWSHEHCKGLKDDDDFLRRVCEVDKDEWPEVRSAVFDNDKFFCQDADGAWHQKFAAEKYKEVETNYNAAVLGGKNRWKNISQNEKIKITTKAGKMRWKKV